MTAPDPEAKRIEAAMQKLRAHDARHAPSFEAVQKREPRAGGTVVWLRVLSVPIAAAAAVMLAFFGLTQRAMDSAPVSAARSMPAASMAPAPAASAAPMAPVLASAASPIPPGANFTPASLPLEFLLEGAASSLLLSDVPNFDLSVPSPKARP